MFINLLLDFRYKVAEIPILDVTLNDNTPGNVLAIDSIRSVAEFDIGNLF